MTQNFNILEGAEPYTAEGGRIGILVSHGFTGTTQSMRPLGEAFAEKGYTVSIPRLKGHGTHPEEMEQTTYHDWIASIDEAFAWLNERCDLIFMAGLSMGGTLALYIAENHPEIRAISLVNAAVDVPSMVAVTDMQDVRFLDAIGSDIKKTGVTELAYEMTPVASVKQLLKFMAEVRSNLAKVQCPTLIFVSPEDHVVPANNAQIIYDEISSKEKSIIEMPDSYHVATLDNDQQRIIDETLAFFKKHEKNNR
ncbi:carboxylesterase [Planomicrobium sp. CPCC 101079]|uniref:alpha/beta hydrolase n=1 Tax=Planomicrobium sp. CPCC 101079 TaxID=2599618 RepID=UPI0011B5564C|nr:alpha/beta fold hydrolase [Planomicrobium sp. CPCC 101079]TWT13137.1 alpha/beta fold hydrolase [Planomicrobium sp. CPCC 101079]